MGRKKRNRGHKSFVMIPRKTLRNKEWKDLTPGAKILYIHIKSKYNGRNNGKIRLYYSELRDIKGLSSDSTINKKFRELENKEWIKRTKLGGCYRYYNEYELTGKHDNYL